MLVASLKNAVRFQAVDFLSTCDRSVTFFYSNAEGVDVSVGENLECGPLFVELVDTPASYLAALRAVFLNRIDQRSFFHSADGLYFFG